MSATPERFFDEEGTKNVFTFFGDKNKPIFNYPIKQAQKDFQGNTDVTILSKYDYYPFLTNLTADEEKSVDELTTEIGILFAEKFQRKIKLMK